MTLRSAHMSYFLNSLKETRNNSTEMLQLDVASVDLEHDHPEWCFPEEDPAKADTRVLLEEPQLKGNRPCQGVPHSGGTRMGAIATIAAVAGLDGRCRLPYCFFAGCLTDQ